MNEGLSAGDILALTKDNDNANWMNNPFIYLVWLALLGNGGIFGGGRNAELQGAITRSDLFEGFNNSFKRLSKKCQIIQNCNKIKT